MREDLIIKGNWDSFLTLSGEGLLLVKRKHMFVLIAPLFMCILMGLAFIAASFFLFFRVYYSFPFFLTTALLVTSITLTIVAKTILDWYFHVYVLTTKKILEYRYTPLSSHVLNGILLDKVNCTEIDLEKSGLISEILDLGNVSITFDRPTHQEEFILEDMTDCEYIGNFLTRELMNRNSMSGNDNTFWFKSRSRAQISN